MKVSYTYIYICTSCMFLVPEESQKRTSNPQELQLWMVVSHHVYFGNRTWVLYKKITALNY